MGLVAAGGWGAAPISATEQAVQTVRLASGSRSGNYYALASEIANRLNVSSTRFRLEVLPSEGSYSNAAMLRAGDADLAIMQGDVAYLENFNGQPFRALASLHTEPIHVAARAELSLRTLSSRELPARPLRVAIGEPGSGSSAHALAVLSTLDPTGTHYRAQSLSLDEAIELLRVREIDLIFRTSAIPVLPFARGAEDGTLVLLSLEKSLATQLRRANPFLTLTEIPWNAYEGQGRNLPTLGTRSLLVTTPKVSSELIFELLDCIYELAPEAKRIGLPDLSDLAAGRGLKEIPIPVSGIALEYHAAQSSPLRRLFTRVRGYALPIVILLLPLLVLYRFSKVAFFIHQFTLGRVLFLLVAVWLIGASVMYLLEGQRNSAFSSFGGSALAILHYLISGLENKYPITVAGHAVSIIVLTMGVALATLFTASLVTMLIERALNIQRLRLKPPSFLKLRDHVVLTGWSDRAERVLTQLRSGDIVNPPPAVVITEDASRTQVHDRRRLRNVWVVEGDCCEKSTLERADVKTARAALVLSDAPLEPKSDFRSVATTLAIKSVDDSVHTIVEALQSSTRPHLQSSRANEVVDVASLTEKAMSQSLVSPGVMNIYDELLSFGRDSQELYIVDLPDELAGKTFTQAQQALLSADAIPIGVALANGGGFELNPRRANGSESRPLDGRLVILADRAEVLEGSAWRRQRASSASAEETSSSAPALDIPRSRERGGRMKERRIGICGWNSQAREIIQQLQDPVISARHRFSFTVISEPERASFDKENGEGLHRNVGFVFGDCTKQSVLISAGLRRFDSLVILANTEDTESSRYSDHRALMVALAALAARSDLHIVAEVLQSENKEHFERLETVELVSVEDLAEKILAQAVLSPGITEVFDRLLTATSDSNEVYIVPVPGVWQGRTFAEVYEGLTDAKEDVILLGYQTESTSGERTLVLNPTQERAMRGDVVNWRGYELRPGDALVAIAYEEPVWS